MGGKHRFSGICFGSDKPNTIVLLDNPLTPQPTLRDSGRSHMASMGSPGSLDSPIDISDDGLPVISSPIPSPSKIVEQVQSFDEMIEEMAAKYWDF